MSTLLNYVQPNKAKKKSMGDFSPEFVPTQKNHYAKEKKESQLFAQTKTKFQTGRKLVKQAVQSEYYELAKNQQYQMKKMEQIIRQLRQNKQMSGKDKKKQFNNSLTQFKKYNLRQRVKKKHSLSTIKYEQNYLDSSPKSNALLNQSLTMENAQFSIHLTSEKGNFCLDEQKQFNEIIGLSCKWKRLL